ncbi:MAG: 4-hydroxy-tetrahydrodipicolinate reductase [Bdellovibrionota bacterium]
MTTTEINKAWIHGYSGRMGEKIKQALENSSFFELIGGSSLEKKDLTKINETDIILDFSSALGNIELLNILETSNLENVAVLIGSTGIEARTKQLWNQLARSQKLSLLFAPNTSLGVLLAAKAALTIGKASYANDFDIEIVETHHKNKIDQPSGTANFFGEILAESISGVQLETNRTGARQKSEIGVHSIRGGGIFGEHEIRFINDHEEVRISHRAFDRDLFANGALVLARWLMRKSSGVYHLLDIDLKDLAL